MEAAGPKYSMTIVDQVGRAWEISYVFDMGYDEEPTGCAAYINEHEVDGEVDDFMPIWRAFKKDEAERAAEGEVWDRRAA